MALRQLDQTIAQPFQPGEIIAWDSFPESLRATPDAIAGIAQMCVSTTTASLCADPHVDAEAKRAAIADELNRIVLEELLFKAELPAAGRQTLSRLAKQLGDDEEGRRRASIHVVSKCFAPHLRIEPYPGPSPFQERDAYRFFGRETKAAEIVSRVISNRVVLVHAPSGAGKTSLLNTRVVPQLKEAGCRVLPPTRFRGPKLSAQIDNPFMYQALTAWDPTSNACPNRTLSEFLAERFPDEDEFEPIVAIFDQFEELFTFYGEAWRKRKDLFCQFRDALDRNRSLRLLLLIREDFTAKLARFAPVLPDRLSIRIELDRLGEQPALDAICGPLERTKRRFAPGVAESLVQTLMRVEDQEESDSEFVEPVQLQVVCHKLWEDLDERERAGEEILEITRDALGDATSLTKALGEYYDKCLASAIVGTSVSEGRLRTWFDNYLITPSHTKGVVLQEGEMVGDLPVEIAKSLESHYLLRSEPRGGHRLFELSHDRFVSAILDSNAKFQRQLVEQAGKKYQKLLAKSAAWEAERGSAGQRAVRYFDRSELRDAHHFLGIMESAGVEPQEHFLESVERSDEAERRREERRKKYLMYAAVAIVICLTTLVYTTLKSWKLATQTVSELLVDTGDARATRFGEIPHAQLLFNESARRVALIGAEAPAGLDIRRNLMWSQLAQPLEMFTHKEQLRALMRHDGKLLLANLGGKLAAWRIDDSGIAADIDHAEVITNESDGELQRIEWQSAGTLFLTSHQLPAESPDSAPKYQLTLWDSAKLRAISSTGPLHDKPVRMGVSADGAYYYAVLRHPTTLADTLVVHSVQENTSRTIAPPRDDQQAAKTFSSPTTISAVEFLPPDTATGDILYADTDNSTWIHRGGTQTNPGTHTNLTDLFNKAYPDDAPSPCTAVATSPDGNLLVTGHMGHVRIWYHRELQQLDHPLVFGIGAESPVTQLTFSANGERLGAIANGIGYVWDLGNSSPQTEESLTVIPHGATLYDIAFSADGTLAATAGRDRTVRIWELMPNQKWRPACAPLFHPGTATRVMFHADGARVFTESGGTGNDSNFAAIWQLPPIALKPPRTVIGDSVGWASLAQAPEAIATHNHDGAKLLTFGERRSEIEASLDGATFASASLSRDHLLVGSDTGQVAIFATSAPDKLVAQFSQNAQLTGPNTEKFVSGIIDSMQRRAVVFSSENSRLHVRMYDWSQGDFSLIGEPIVRAEQLHHAAFAPSGQRLLWTTSGLENGKGHLHFIEFDNTAPGTAKFSHQEAIADETVLHASFNESESRVIASTKHDNALLIDVSNMEILREFQHTADVTFAMLKTIRWNGRPQEIAVTCSEDSSARVWNATTGKPLSNELAHEGYVTHAAIDSNRQLLVTAGLDGAVRIWSLPQGEVIGLLYTGQPVRRVGVRDSEVVAVSSDSEELSGGPAQFWRWTISGVPMIEFPTVEENDYLELLACHSLTGTELVRMESAMVRRRWHRLRKLVQNVPRAPHTMQSAQPDAGVAYSHLREILGQQQAAEKEAAENEKRAQLAQEQADERAKVELAEVKRSALDLWKENKEQANLIAKLKTELAAAKHQSASQYRMNSRSKYNAGPSYSLPAPSLAPR
ncbi:MAG: hypothetical protein KDB14_31095 [Planctomycetales bacterium]|nr:hypothetical protein [Planctomycetales bacterium]